MKMQNDGGGGGGASGIIDNVKPWKLNEEEASLIVRFVFYIGKPHLCSFYLGVTC
jgi:hypothetical protein